MIPQAIDTRKPAMKALRIKSKEIISEMAESKVIASIYKIAQEFAGNVPAFPRHIEEFRFDVLRRRIKTGRDFSARGKFGEVFRERIVQGERRIDVTELRRLFQKEIQRTLSVQHAVRGERLAVFVFDAHIRKDCARSEE